MAGPWDDYAAPTAQGAASGPWQDYAQPQAAAQAPDDHPANDYQQPQQPVDPTEDWKNKVGTWAKNFGSTALSSYIGMERGAANAAASLQPDVWARKGMDAGYDFMQKFVHSPPSDPSVVSKPQAGRPSTIFDSPSLIDVANDTIQNKAKAAQNVVNSWITPEFQQAAQKSVFEGALKDPDWWSSQVASAVPYLASGIGEGAMVRGAYGLRALEAAKEVAAQDMPQTAARAYVDAEAKKAASRTAMALSTTMGGTFAGQASQDVKDTIADQPEDVLMKFPEYRQAREQGLPDSVARARLESNRGLSAFAEMGAASAVTGPLMGRLLSHVATGQRLAASRLGQVGVGAVEAGVGGGGLMGAQAGAESYETSPNHDIAQAAVKAKDAALGAGIASMAMGGAFSAAGHGMTRPEAQDLANTNIANADEVRKAMQDKRDTEHAQAQEESDAKAKEARDNADVEKKAKLPITGPKLTPPTAVTQHELDVVRQDILAKRNAFVDSHRRVLEIEAAANDPDIPVSYNDLERARNDRQSAFENFRDAAKDAGIIGDENGRAETEGSNRDRQRETGAASDVVPGLGVNGARDVQAGSDGQRALGEDRGPVGERVQRGAGEGQSAEHRDDEGIVSGRRGEPGIGDRQGQGPGAGRAADTERKSVGQLDQPSEQDIGRTGQEPGRTDGGQAAEIPAQAGYGPGRERTREQRSDQNEQGGTLRQEDAERGQQRRGLATSEQLALGGPLMPETEREAGLNKAAKVSTTEEQPSSPAVRAKLRTELSKTGVTDKQFAANLASIPRNDNLKPDAKRVEGRMAATVADVPAAESAYAQIPGAEGGRVINTDLARELSPDYNKDDQSRALHSQSVQEPSSWLADKLYDRRIAEPKRGNGDVLFTAGGSNAGKSVSLKSDDARKADIVYDGNMNTLQKARRRIKAALDSGRKVKIQFSYRDPIDAFRNGVLPRALKFGRTVPVEVHADTHNGSFKVVTAIARQYEHDNRVQVGALDTGELKPTTMKAIAQKRYDVTPAELRQVAIEEYHRGNITEDILRGVGGESAVRMARRGEDHGQLPGKPVERPGEGTSAGSEAGERAGGSEGREVSDRESARQEARLGKDLSETIHAGPLEGIPSGGEPTPAARTAAAEYMHDAGIKDYRPPRDFVKADPRRGAEIARAYDAMEHNPSDPKVEASYDALIKETLHQWDAIKATGLKVEFIKPGQDNPYAQSPRMAIDDVKDNNHLWVFPTEQGFGSGDEFPNHPLMQTTSEVVDGKNLVANDVFRIVHDYFGHVKEGNGFRADGELNAWRQHAAMYSEAAQGALASETLGQNSWVNYGPHGDANRTAGGDKTVYADQKAGLLPEKFWKPETDAYAVAPTKNLAFRHFTTLNQHEVTLSPEFYGRGLKGAEASRIAGGAPKVISAYGIHTPRSQIEFPSTHNEYEVRVPQSKMYDLSADPLGVIAKSRNPAGGYDHTKAEQTLKAMGYTGYHIPQGREGFKGQARFFKPVRATRVGLDRDARARVIQRVKTDWGHDIRIVDSQADAGVPENRTIQGVFNPTPDGGRVTLIARNLRSEDEASSVAAHEIAGHFGIRGVLGGYESPHYQRTMDQIATAFPELTQYAAQRNHINLNDADPVRRAINRRSAAEELMAYTAQDVAQRGRASGAYATIVATIRDALRQIGVVKTYGPKDVAALIDRAADYARRGGTRAARNRDLVAADISGRPAEIASLRAPWAVREGLGGESAAQREARETLTPVAAHLTDEERRGLSRASARKVVDLFRKLPPVDQFSAAALGGLAKRGWYKQSAEALSNTFGPDAPRVAALIGATSPQTSVEMNLRNAMGVWSNWVKAGRPTDRKSIIKAMGEGVQGHKKGESVLPAWINNTVRALTHPDPEKLNLSGPKVHSFMRNLQGAVHDVTLDTWMANFAGVKQSMFSGGMKAGDVVAKRPGYLAYSARVREAAADLSKRTGETWTPAEVQETIWSWAKTAYEEADSLGGLGGIDDLVKSNEITDKLVAGTPDFATLLAGPEHEQFLRDAGLGSRIDELRQRTAQRAEPGTPSEAAQAARASLQKPLLAAARRLEGVRQARAAEPAFATQGDHDAAMKSFVAKIAPKGPGWQSVVTETVKDTDHIFKQWIDSLHGIQKAATEAGHPETSAGYMSATLAKNTGALMKLIMYHGGVEWRDDAPGMRADSVGLVDILRPLGGKVGDFFNAMVARRAQRLMSEGREHNFTADELRAGNDLWTKNPEFEAAFQHLAGLKRSILDFAQSAGTIDPESRKLWENDDHIPFYRVMNPQMEVKGVGTGVMGRVKKQIQRLKGGTAPIGDPMVNMVKNWQSLVQSALSNKAQLLTIDGLRGLNSTAVERIENQPPNTSLTKEAFKEQLRDGGVDPGLLSEPALHDMYLSHARIPDEPNQVWVWRGGKKELYRVNDDFLYKSMTDMNSSGPGTVARVLTNIMRPAASLVRFGVVKNPFFAVSIFMRHTMMLYTTGAEGTHGVLPGFKPFVDAWSGVLSQMRNTPEALDLAAAGGTFHEAHGFGDAEDASKALKTALAPKSPAGSVTAGLGKFWDVYNRFLAASEGAYRIAVAREVGRQGGSRLEQAYAARRVLNYSHTPGSALLKFVASTVPFTKAHLAGSHNFIDRLSQDPKGVMLRGALLSLATMAYVYANHQDPRYQQLTDDQRNHYFHFWDVLQPGDHIQVPRPFDMANLFITAPEAVMNMALSHEDDRVRTAAQGLGASLWESFNYDYVPAMVRPWLDLRMNERNSLTMKTGTPILTARDQEVAPEAQDAPYVSPTYRAVATNMPALAPDWLRSPKQLQFLASSYLGTVGQYAASATDAMLSSGETAANRGHGEDITGLRQIYSGGPAYRTRYMDSMYDVSKQIQSTYNTYKSEIAGGRGPQARETIQQNVPLLRVRQTYDDATRAVSELRKSQRQIQDSNMEPVAKRAALDKLQTEMNGIAQKVYQLRPGGKLNPRDAGKLIGANKAQAVGILQQAGLPATSAILQANSQELAA